MPGASYEALRRYQQGQPASEAAPAAIITKLREMQKANALANAQHNIDLGTPMFGADPTGAKRAAFDRAAEHVGEGMDVGGLTAWHGSHALFNKFDPTKLGTGEGAQVYGNGLYLAGNKAVAQQYQKNVPGAQIGKRMSDEAQHGFDSSEVYRSIMTDPSVPKEQKRFIAALKQDDWLGFDYPHQAIREALNRPGDWDLSPKTIDAANKLGHLYKVDLPDPHVSKMIDWDKPLFDQQGTLRAAEAASNLPENSVLRQALDALDKQEGIRKGRDLVNAGLDQAPNRRAEAAMANEMSRAFGEAGIPGIKYLDQGSRFNRGGNTSNYVVFPQYQDQLTILDRNGVPLGLAGGAP